AVTILVYISLRGSDINNLLFAAVIVLTITAVMATIEFLRAPWSPLKSSTQTLERTLHSLVAETSLQWLGMLGYFCVVLFAWWLLAEYSQSYYEPFFAILPLLMLAGPVITA